MANIYGHFIEHSKFEEMAKKCKPADYFKALADERYRDYVILNVPSSVRTFDKELFKTLFYVKPLVQKCMSKRSDLP